MLDITRRHHMKRADAYAALAGELEQCRLRPTAELASRVGLQPTLRHIEVAGEVFTIEVSVAWADRSQNKLKLEAVANGSSHWSTERLVEQITVMVR